MKPAVVSRCGGVSAALPINLNRKVEPVKSKITALVSKENVKKIKSNQMKLFLIPKRISRFGCVLNLFNCVKSIKSLLKLPYAPSYIKFDWLCILCVVSMGGDQPSGYAGTPAGPQ